MTAAPLGELFGSRAFISASFLAACRGVFIQGQGKKLEALPMVKLSRIVHVCPTHCNFSSVPVQ